jgi:hypothetical protein
LVCVLAPLPALAQAVGASLGGTVRDPDGAVVPGVVIKVSSLDTGSLWTTASDDAGQYAFGWLPRGRFTIEAQRPGFKTFATEPFAFEASRPLRLDIGLEVGPLSETVLVEAGREAASQLTPAQTFRLDRNEASELPANGDNYLALTLIAPGSVSSNPTSFTTGQRMTSAGRPVVNGNRKESSSFLLDGIDINQTTDNLVAYLPNPDAIEQVALTTSAASAEQGNYLGAIVGVTLKSGTNEWHGSASGQWRDEALNAASWAGGWQPVDPLNPERKTPLTHYTYGGTIGGRLIRDRLFFFGDYQRARRRVGPVNTLLSFIAEPMRRGDFSALLQGTNPQQLYDPLTTRPDPANPAGFIRDPFPGNQIPLGRINPVPAALFRHPLYPLPDVPGLVANTFARSTSALNIDQGDLKLDARLNAEDHVSARVSYGVQDTFSESSHVIVPGAASTSPFRSIAARCARDAGPRFVNEATVGFTDVDLEQSGDRGGVEVGNLGEALGIAGANRRRAGLPLLAFGGAAGSVGNAGVTQSFDSEVLQLQNTATWALGPSLFKAGMLVLRNRQRVYFSGNNGQLGAIDFTGQYTRNLGDPRSLGSPIADFFLGYPSRLARGDFAETWEHQTSLYAGFAQYDWQARSTLTVNLGLRYEYRRPLVEARDRQVNIDLATGEFLFAGRDGNSRALYEPYPSDWQPRVGVAWTSARSGGRLLLRGSYGMTSFQEGTGTNLRLPMNPPFFNELELVNADPARLPSTVNAGFDGLRERDPLTGTVLRVGSGVSSEAVPPVAR